MERYHETLFRAQARGDTGVRAAGAACRSERVSTWRCAGVRDETPAAPVATAASRANADEGTMRTTRLPGGHRRGGEGARQGRCGDPLSANAPVTLNALQAQTPAATTFGMIGSSGTARPPRAVRPRRRRGGARRRGPSS